MSKILLRMFSLWYLSVTWASLHISMKSPQVHHHNKVKLTLSVPYWNLPPLWKVGCTLTRSIPGLQSISFSADPHSNYKCQRPAPNMVPSFFLWLSAPYLCGCGHYFPVCTFWRQCAIGLYIVSYFLTFCRKYLLNKYLWWPSISQSPCTAQCKSSSVLDKSPTFKLMGWFSSLHLQILWH